jgi:nucleotide-binding universal stress UspA family protein
MKNILLLAHDDAGQEARFQAALDVARRFDAHLSCLDVAVIPEVIGNFYGGLGKALVLHDLREQEAGNRQRLEQRLAVEQVPWTWQDGSGKLSRCLQDAATLADLIILNRDLDFLLMPDMGAAIGDALAKTRVPILAVAGDAGGLDLDGSALVAWDGSPTAVAALKAAVPLLKLAGDVCIYVVDDGSIEVPAEEAAIYLSRHAVHATIRRDSAPGERPATVVLAEVERIGAEYVVMGGYGHSPLVEGLIGGMTHKMLRESPVPIFLAH